MEAMIVQGVSDQEVENMIEQNTRGWHLFFYPPTGADDFINTFWGREWDGKSSNDLKDAIVTVCKNYKAGNGKVRHSITLFKLDGMDRFAFCSWTKQLYDFNTKKYHLVEVPYCPNIVKLIWECTGTLL